MFLRAKNEETEWILKGERRKDKRQREKHKKKKERKENRRIEIGSKRNIEK